ncbi:MAG: 30S ribosomal protein S27ae [Candidatus Micrarchaeia archaeon]|jgi:small subunit ribosomal protein S27Ae
MPKEEKGKKEFKPYKPGKFCPKCGSRMAEHEDRYTCGKCGYTEWKRSSKEKDLSGGEKEDE